MRQEWKTAVCLLRGRAFVSTSPRESGTLAGDHRVDVASNKVAHPAPRTGAAEGERRIFSSPGTHWEHGRSLPHGWEVLAQSCHTP